MIDLPTIASAWAIEDRYELSWWDALIAAAAKAADCAHLFSEDLQDGQVLDAVTVIDPFTLTPASILPRKTRNPPARRTGREGSVARASSS